MRGTAVLCSGSGATGQAGVARLHRGNAVEACSGSEAMSGMTEGVRQGSQRTDTVAEGPHWRGKGMEVWGKWWLGARGWGVAWGAAYSWAGAAGSEVIVAVREGVQRDRAAWYG